MLRATVTHFDKSWDKCLPLAEFSYNNSYQTSLKMAPFEALYGRRCRTPLNWSESGERRIYGPDLVVDAEEKVAIIQANLKSTQSRQKSYHDQRKKPLRFNFGDHIYLKVLLTRGAQRFGVRGKLALASSAYTRSSRSVDPSPTSSNCPISLQPSTMSSTSPSWRNVFEFLKKSSLKKNSMLSHILPMKNIRSRSSTRSSVRQEPASPSCT